MFFDIGILVLRIVVGASLMGHGAQKLFGWFGGPGLKSFANGMTKMGLRPASFWAFMGGLAEFGGGGLFALGWLNPLGALGISAVMLTVIITIHWSKGYWNAKGGIEYPLANLTVAVAVALSGPGAYSLDGTLGIALPEPVSVIGGYALVLLGVIAMLASQKHQPATNPQPKTT